MVAGARNALELARLGRLGEDYAAPYEVVDQGEHHRLRRYATCDRDDAPVALFVPPLMVTSEVYDVAPDVSAVATLGARGIQPFVVDFGAPEHQEGGMHRTLDDHVRAVLRSIDRARELTGRDVHLLGYSQGGMFCYQAAAYRRSAGIRSLVTFGSPVDIHKGVPGVRADLTGAFVRAIEPAVSSALERIEGLPGALTSTAFKLVSTRKEIEQRIDFLRLLHDRSALVRREARRRFLGGAGFVAWPGPAFRVFVDDFIVHNRMLAGGFVIDGRTVTLADITCPILAFIGTTDEIARPASVRAIIDAAPGAFVEIASVPAGHFGIVVGSRASQVTWPKVASWIFEREASAAPSAPPPSVRAPAPEADDLEAAEFDGDFRLFVDTALDSVKAAWRRAGDAASSAYDAYDAIRYQEPRLRRLAALGAGSRVSPGRALAERAAKSPDAVFFLWHDRAFSYRVADQRVTNVAKGLYACGVRPGDRVGVVMRSRPSFLSAVTALSRLGAVPVLAPPEAADADLSAALAEAGARFVVSDPELGARCRALGDRPVLVLGGGGRARSLEPGLVDMEAIDPAAAALPAGFELDAGLARDVALVLLRPSERGGLRAAPVTNHRWALSALGAAAACTLKPNDTVYSCVPLHHPTGVLVGVGAAIAGGSRLALAEGFDPERFSTDARRYGATVVFYAGEMLRSLLRAPPSRADRSLPVRLFAGSGVRPALARALTERFGASVLEFYGGTTQKVILANAAGGKPGALGRVLPGSAAVRLVRADVDTGLAVRGRDGRLEEVGPGEPGLLVARLSDEDDVAAPGVVSGAFSPGDAWFVSSDVLCRDADGDYFFVDSLGGYVKTGGGPVSTRAVEDALYGLPEVELAAAWGERDRVVAAVVASEPLSPARLAEAVEPLAAHARPTQVVQLPRIPMTDGYRPRRRDLPALAAGAGHRLVLEPDRATYRASADEPARSPEATA